MVQTITADLIKGKQKLKFLPRHFNRYMLVAETAIYEKLTKFCKSYSGGVWNFYDLSNGGFYLAPDIEELLPIFIDTNDFEDTVSADAAGIICTLFVLNEMSWATANFSEISQNFAKAYHLLRDYIECHPEFIKIWRALD